MNPSPSPTPRLLNAHHAILPTRLIPLDTSLHLTLDRHLFHINRCTQEKIPSIANLNSMMSSVWKLTGSPQGGEIRLDISVEGDISVQAYSTGSSEGITFRDTTMQNELRRWLGPGSEQRGIYKPDTMAVLTITNIHSGLILRTLSLIGEGKVDLVLRGKPTPSSASERIDGSSVLTTNDRSRRGKKWRSGLAKAIVYLRSAHQAFGTYLAITIVGSEFARLLFLANDIIALECEDTFFNDLSERDRCQSASTFLTTLTNVDHLPHNLSSTVSGNVSIDLASLATLYETYAAAVSILLSLQAQPSITRIPPVNPNAPVTAAVLSRASKHDISDDQERFNLVRRCRPDVTWRSPPKASSRIKRRKPDDEDEASRSGSRGKEGPRRSSRLATTKGNKSDDPSGSGGGGGGGGGVSETSGDRVEEKGERERP